MDSYSNETPDRFTPQAHTVMQQARQEAEQLKHRYIGSEHLLLALVHDEDGAGSQVLGKLGISGEQVRHNVLLTLQRQTNAARLRITMHRLMHDLTHRADKQDGLDEMELTKRARRCIALAVGEAHRRGSHAIGAEHLLFGLVSEGEGIAAQSLHNLAVYPEQVRDQLQILN